MGEGILTKFKNWMTDEEEEFEYEEEVNEESQQEDDESLDQFKSLGSNKTAKIVNIHNASQMKVVIVEPKKYEEVTIIADHLKQRKAVIVNLENLEDVNVRKSIFEFINGAVYVLEGDMQKVSKAIFILAPNNVNIDASIKKELESKTTFPFYNK